MGKLLPTSLFTKSDRLRVLRREHSGRRPVAWALQPAENLGIIERWGSY